MRLYSKTRSNKSFEISILAIIESAVAIAISLWFAWTHQSVLHILVTSLVAPFLLLRTEASTKLGLKYFDSVYGGRISRKVLHLVTSILVLLIVIFLGLDPLVGLIILIFGAGIVLVPILGSLVSRIASILKTFVQSPINSILEIPNNWYRVVFCIDSTSPPELVPGIEMIKDEEGKGRIFDFKLRNALRDGLYALRRDSFSDKFLGFVWLLYIPILIFPPLFYRWSLKSSSIIWLPLIWIINGNKDQNEKENKKLQVQLIWMRKSIWSKITAVYAFIVIFLFTALPLLIKGKLQSIQENLSEIPNGSGLNELLNFFFAFQMHAWHWSRFFVAILTLVTFFYADKLLIKRSEIQQAGLTTAPFFIRFILLLRVPLSLFTIACGFYLLVKPINWHEQLQNMQWLPFGS